MFVLPILNGIMVIVVVFDKKIPNVLQEPWRQPWELVYQSVAGQIHVGITDSNVVFTINPLKNAPPASSTIRSSKNVSERKIKDAVAAITMIPAVAVA